MQIVIQQKIRSYGIKTLHKKTGIAISTLYRILDGRAVIKGSLDTLYNFFGIGYDSYYYSCVKKATQKEIYRSVGGLIRQIRIRIGMDISTLAQKSKMSYKQIIRIEGGQQIPNRDSLELILSALQLPAEEIVEILKIRDGQKVLVEKLKYYQTQ